MNAKIIAFFNYKSGVGKTSLVYHLAWMYKDLGLRVLTADLDPQANLTTTFLNEERWEEICLKNDTVTTVYDCLQKCINDILHPRLEYILEYQLPHDLASFCAYPELEKLALLPGQLTLSTFEEDFAIAWHNCLTGSNQEKALRVTSAFWRILQSAAAIHQAEIILVDLSPNLGAINRAALIAADYLVIPLKLDLFSLLGLPNMGSVLQTWRNEWQNILHKNPHTSLSLPSGNIQPIGYTILRMPMRLDLSTKIYNRAVREIPSIYEEFILNQSSENNISVDNDTNCLSLLKTYPSLMPIAQEAHKPMFHLKPADGILGSYSKAVSNVYRDFKNLAYKIAEKTQLTIPDI